MSVKISRAFPEQVSVILENMVSAGIYGRSVNEVMERCVSRWIIEHVDELKRLDIVPGDWK